MKDKHEIAWGHMGNGISVWIKTTNNVIAHIDAQRNISYRNKSIKLRGHQLREIEDIAAYSDPAISFTQRDQFVFDNPPKVLMSDKVNPDAIEQISPTAVKYRDQVYAFDGNKWKNISKTVKS